MWREHFFILYSLTAWNDFPFPGYTRRRGRGEEREDRACGTRSWQSTRARGFFASRNSPSPSNSWAYRSNRSKKPCGSSRLRLNDEGSMVFSSFFYYSRPISSLSFLSFFPPQWFPPKCSTIEHSRRISRESRSAESSRLTSASMQLGRCYVMWTGKRTLTPSDTTAIRLRSKDHGLDRVSLDKFL